ncbi:MAG: hypothetical protein RMJ36_01765 [Candidatus Calescibacterium sp.]|nr:hypothetical protein [Candidatus Calescibacterium sp.]MDW8132365.1 hypothetical protein [Candidatus Calescibacterium sp.]
MSSILTQIFLESLLSLPLPIALEKIKTNEDIENKDVKLVFIDQINKEYFEKNKGYDINSLRVVNVKMKEQINIYVAYEISELIDMQREKKC